MLWFFNGVYIIKELYRLPWRDIKIFLLVLKWVKTLEKKFCISARSCNILLFLFMKKHCYRIYLVCPLPHNFSFRNYCFQFLPGITVVPTETETILEQNFGSARNSPRNLLKATDKIVHRTLQQFSKLTVN